MDGYGCAEQWSCRIVLILSIVIVASTENNAGRCLSNEERGDRGSRIFKSVPFDSEFFDFGLERLSG